MSDPRDAAVVKPDRRPEPLTAEEEAELCVQRAEHPDLIGVTHFDAVLATLEAERQKAEREAIELIEERDNLMDRLDVMANAIAPMEVIGEHSNLNDPWANAVEALDAERAAHAADR
jgi:hypothetical protein